MIRPLNNHCLIEVIDEYEGIMGATTDNVQKGILRDTHLDRVHLTASAGVDITHYSEDIRPEFEKLKGKTVYWQEYADIGSKFHIGGKDYVLVPFYRLIGVEE